jgi:hypothetical protein
MLAAFALVAALSGIGGAYAGTVLVGSKQIRNGSIRTQDIHNNEVRSTDVRNGAVASADIGEGEVHSGDIGTNQVEPSDLELPDPQQGVEGGASQAMVGSDFAVVDPVETYTKIDPSSVLEVTWTGSASAGFVPCQFQIRVDGQPAAPGAGVLYVPNGTVNGNVTISVDFGGLPAGPHSIAVYARALGTGETFPCTVGPDQAQLAQTFVTAEQVT